MRTNAPGPKEIPVSVTQNPRTGKTTIQPLEDDPLIERIEYGGEYDAVLHPKGESHINLAVEYPNLVNIRFLPPRSRANNQFEEILFTKTNPPVLTLFDNRRKESLSSVSAEMYIG